MRLLAFLKWATTIWYISTVSAVFTKGAHALSMQIQSIGEALLPPKTNTGHTEERLE